MSFGLFRRDPPSRLPDDVSPVYYHLYDRINGHPNFTPALRQIVFCVAYTLYSLRKRDDVLKEVLRGRSRTHPSIARSFAKYINEPGGLNEVISDATDISGQYADELRSFLLLGTVQKVDTLTTKLDQHLQDQTALVAIPRKFDQLTTDVRQQLANQNSLIHRRERFSWAGFRAHFSYAFLTALISVIAVQVITNYDDVLSFLVRVFQGMIHLFWHG
jgi:hypothetical protein